MTAQRRLLTAELLSVGTEVVVGETRDTNAGELGGSLTAAGVRVTRITALPDQLDTVADAYRSALSRVDLVVSTGGLGPTPDDLTREAIARVWNEEPVVDPSLEAWLRDLWARRGIDFPSMNLKQAWLIPSAVALANPNGTAPGWLVSGRDGQVAVALPGPPREMRPMWANEALPRLVQLGLGADIASRTYRLAGIGESQVAELLGESLLRSTEPTIATYARAEAVDVRISATGRGDRSAASLVEESAAVVLEHVGRYVWATGTTTWSEAIGLRLAGLEWTVAIVEIGTAGSVAALFGDVPWVRFGESIAADAPAARVHGVPASDRPAATEHETDASDHDLPRFAERARELGGSEVGLAVRTQARAGDTAVSIAIVTPLGARQVRRAVFLSGPMGRTRAALAAAAVLLESLPRAGHDGSPESGSSA